MNLLQYKEKTKCKIVSAVVAALLLFAYYIDGGSILSGFKDMKNIWIYVGIRDVLPALFVLLTGVFILIKSKLKKGCAFFQTFFIMTKP